MLLLAVLAATSAQAGPPFMTDDPEPTADGHWEIYSPFVEIDGRSPAFSGSTGVEINYGAAQDLQLTVDLPVNFTHDRAGWQSGVGDMEVSAKYRIMNDTGSGIQIALFPGLSIPTASNGLGAGHATALLPVWAQKDSGDWSIFGGGGYAINPGAGNRDYWTCGLAVSRQVGDRLLLGLEADRQSADQVGGGAKTSLGAGAIYDLKGPLRLLASSGPTFEDGARAAGYHAFVALGLDF